MPRTRPLGGLEGWEEEVEEAEGEGGEWTREWKMGRR